MHAGVNLCNTPRLHGRTNNSSSSAELSRVFTVRLEKRILVREEYRVAYDYFEANANLEPAIGRAARYILMGYPGIGMCFDGFHVFPAQC